MPCWGFLYIKRTVILLFVVIYSESLTIAELWYTKFKKNLDARIQGLYMPVLVFLFPYD